MKTKFLVLTLVLAIASFAVNAQTAKTETIKVYGNCAQCKSHIQKAAKAGGAAVATWNVDTKVLSVSFDATKTSSKKIQDKIAEAGYDTQDATATKAAYEKLDECCQYDRKKAKG
ncbi:heavy-metal-associated domain-containing protein [Parasediminibacterium sp. JCM 36343]|uniref:heavy-metal-associated domain-containing protein n=1 Tax=Parasediminibacterium sp. JCM 36343 TaxID=3374279 RepID=UPI00397A890D